MKKFLCCAALLWGCLTATAQTPLERHWKKEVEKVRIMSYNILNGFDWGNDTEREERLVEWVRHQDPEILGLQELCGFTQEKLQKLAQRWGHPYAMIVKEEGYPVGITSKRPITLKTKLLENAGHGMLHVQTYGWDVIVTHLNPSNTVRRNTEARTIADYIRTLKTDSCILMGDMNAHSPFDGDYTETHAINLTAHYGGAESKNLLDGGLDYSVIALSVPAADRRLPSFCRPRQPHHLPHSHQHGAIQAQGGACTPRRTHRLHLHFALAAPTDSRCLHLQRRGDRLPLGPLPHRHRPAD